MPTIVGSIMIPRIMETVSTLFPVPPKRFLMIGTTTTMPKKPYTMDGMPARRFIGGMSHLKSFLGQNFAINIAVKSPIGTPIIIAPAVQ